MTFGRSEPTPQSLGVFDGKNLLGVYPIQGFAPTLETWRGVIAENHPDFIGKEGELTALTVPANPEAIVEIMADELQFSNGGDLSDRQKMRQSQLAALASFLSATEIK